MKVHSYDGVGFGTRVCTKNVGMNAYFGPSMIKRPFPTPKYVLYALSICSIARKTHIDNIIS